MENISIPHRNNFCGGNFQDWLEVNLIDKCNASCPWCIEKNGYHPIYHASTETLAKRILETGKTNIILLGGEPLLYKEISKLIQILSNANLKVWITTNGCLLSEKFIFDNLIGIFGINISIHHFDLYKNYKITGLLLSENKIKKSIDLFNKLGVSVRMNCNIIKGNIDNRILINKYVLWAKKIGANKIRFAELKGDDDSFINLASILDYQYGLNDDPFTNGCNSDCTIYDIPINFRQMCGLQTNKRIAPENPKQFEKDVLYYDGLIYRGWQTTMEKKMNMDTVEKIIKKITNDKLNDDEIKSLVSVIRVIIQDEISQKRSQSSGGCQY